MHEFGKVDVDELLREVREYWLAWKDTLPWTEKMQELSRGEEYVAYEKALEASGSMNRRFKFLDYRNEGRHYEEIPYLEAIRKSGDYAEWIYRMIRWYDFITDTDTPIHRVDVPYLLPGLYEHIVNNSHRSQTGTRGEVPVLWLLYELPIRFWPSAVWMIADGV